MRFKLCFYRATARRACCPSHDHQRANTTRMKKSLQTSLCILHVRVSKDQCEFICPVSLTRVCSLEQRNAPAPALGKGDCSAIRALKKSGPARMECSGDATRRVCDVICTSVSKVSWSSDERDRTVGWVLGWYSTGCRALKSPLSRGATC
jgi:hypothetical protein